VYGMSYVNDQDMPDGQEWMVAETTDGDDFVFVRQSAGEDAERRALEAYRRLKELEDQEGDEEDGDGA
jgi:hypothetical protein